MLHIKVDSSGCNHIESAVEKSLEDLMIYLCTSRSVLRCTSSNEDCVVILNQVII